MGSIMNLNNKAATLPACCTDFDIDPLDLLFPERMGRVGLEFCRLHGLDAVPIEKLVQDARILENGWVKIKHRCVQLTDAGQCKIYDKRPQVCKDFDCAKRTDCKCNGTGKWSS
jgi:Fe-S-cluster containining protein